MKRGETWVTLHCQQCDKRFERPRSQVRRHWFCTVRCRAAWGLVLVDAGRCEMCDQPMTRKRGIDQHKRFCSSKCRVRGHVIRTILKERGKAA